MPKSRVRSAPAGRGASGVVWDLQEVTTKLAILPVGFNRMLTAVDDRLATEAQDYMRTNAPWTDRTGNARNGLFGKAVQSPDKHAIVLYHTAPYGIWLEVRWSGKFAIIEPTVQVMGPRYMQMVQRLLDRMVG